uniref:Expressed protein n=3 Tax=Oryza sativa subsp. japonica TaxID=39947 RepID=Q2R978_ORYSJ|nr:expressed protein [Oryza sativa Japonica Group]ABA91920.2 expressed protein [Oryza sativa Japonica Group]
MPSLVDAFVGVLNWTKDYCIWSDSGDCGHENCESCYGIKDNNCVLLEGLSEAKTLGLISERGSFILKRDLKWRPTFTKLKTLLLNEYWCVPDDFSALTCILQHAPVLENLILQICSKFLVLRKSRFWKDMTMTRTKWRKMKMRTLMKTKTKMKTLMETLMKMKTTMKMETKWKRKMFDAPLF